MSESRVLIYDIETAPAKGFVWEKYRTNVLKFDTDWYMLSFAWKWLGEKKTHVLALPDFDLYKKEPMNDRLLVEQLRDLFDQADVTVTHNGITFDGPKANSRMAVHGLTPPSPYQEVDTLKVARKMFGFASNSLKDLCQFLGLPDKGDPGSIETWVQCMNGNPRAWARMKKYNKQDVAILEQLYLRFLPWIPRHPHMGMLSDRPAACPRCGEGPLVARGWRIYAVSRRRKFRCGNCGGYCLGRKLERSNVEYVAL